MIIADLADSARYEKLHPLFKLLMDYVKSHDFSEVAPGRIEIQGDDLFINVDETVMQPKEERKLEVHRWYIDVQIPLSATEMVAWQPLSTIRMASDAPFDETRDCALYSMQATNYFEAHPGQFYMLFPEDAHGPIIGQGPIKKLDAKLKVTAPAD